MPVLMGEEKKTNVFLRADEPSIAAAAAKEGVERRESVRRTARTQEQILMALPWKAAADIIARLDLKPHPEGGHYRDTFATPKRGRRVDVRDRPRSISCSPAANARTGIASMPRRPGTTMRAARSHAYEIADAERRAQHQARRRSNGRRSPAGSRTRACVAGRRKHRRLDAGRLHGRTWIRICEIRTRAEGLKFPSALKRGQSGNGWVSSTPAHSFRPRKTRGAEYARDIQRFTPDRAGHPLFRHAGGPDRSPMRMAPPTSRRCRRRGGSVALHARPRRAFEDAREHDANRRVRAQLAVRRAGWRGRSPRAHHRLQSCAAAQDDAVIVTRPTSSACAASRRCRAKRLLRRARWNVRCRSKPRSSRSTRWRRRASGAAT